MILVATVIVTPLAVFMMALPPNGDIAWLLYAARVVRHGAVLGRDVLEVNPPLVIWLQVPIVWLADVARLPPGAVYALSVALLAVACVALAERVLESAAPEWNAMRRLAFAAACALALVLEAGQDFGQREHLSVMLSLPWILLLAARWRDGSVGARLAATCGALGALGLALKPFFLPLFLVAEASVLLRRGVRTWRSRPELATAAGVFLIYAALLVTVGRPWVVAMTEQWPLYARYVTLSAAEFLVRNSWRTALVAAACLAAAGVLAARGRSAAISGALVLGTLGYALAALLQRRPWSYMLLAAGVLALLTLASVALASSGIVTRRGRLVRAALVVVLACIVLGEFAWELARARAVWRLVGAADSPHGRLLATMRRLGPVRSLATLSTSHFTAFPLVLELGADWGMRMNSLWPLTTVHPVEELARQHRLPIRTMPDPPTPADTLVTRLLREDLVRSAPQFLIVPVPVDSLEPDRGVSPAFDYFAYFGRDSVIAMVFTRYWLVQEVAGHRIYARRDGP